MNRMKNKIEINREKEVRKRKRSNKKRKLLWEGVSKISSINPRINKK
jgi:hypothetical protein